ncbi:MAG: phytoene desaturase [Bacteroidetes bacterium]|nr:phytoene desaturase [Bacteroidota bacterium]
MGKRCVVIGSGFAGLAGAAVLAQAGLDVTIVERNATPGGRARTWTADGFTFDMGPSFYWMPEVFDRFFARFGHRTADQYRLVRLDPSYRVIFGRDDAWSLPAGTAAVARLFEAEEPGAAAALGRYLQEAQAKYDLGMGDLVHRPSLSWAEYARPRVLTGLMRTTVFRSFRTHVRRHFRSERIRRVMEFPALFLGASPQRTPALYSLMSHADIALGTWYPMGGMGRVVDAFARLAQEQGAVLRTNEAVHHIRVADGRVVGVDTANGPIDADIVLATADHHHVETALLEPGQRMYDERYWASRTMAPSVLLFFLGLDRRLEQLAHHTLFFDASLDAHIAAIHERRTGPERPLFHVSRTSATDPSVAPPGGDALVVLIPIASGSPDDEALRARYFTRVMDRMTEHLGIDPRPHIVVQRSYGVNDLAHDHNAYLGNAYGLASTLRQTGPGRPRMKSRKVAGLYHAGQLNVPGPGVPPAIISGQVAADLILREHAGA